MATKELEKTVVLCPRCSAQMVRLPRNFSMRLRVGSKHYKCFDCDGRYLKTLFGSLIKLSRW